MMETVEVNHAYIEEVMGKARQAAEKFAQYDRNTTDTILKVFYEAAFNHRFRLAEMAHRESGIGKVDDKVIKNIIATRFVYYDIRDFQAAGVIIDDPLTGITEIARPLGPVFAITPVTNPTSTVLFKILIRLKTSNLLIISPHGAARKCSIEAARICYEAAIAAGAPENCIQWLKRVSKDDVLAFMAHKKQL